TAATPVQIRLGSPLGKKLSSRKTGELLCLSGENRIEILWCRRILAEKPQVFREATTYVAFRNTSGFSAGIKRG
ncbi:hypothetical protein, partial [Rothia mucilaginosa]|uniref:hypothetical protein n=1 Tax=Rothia mucilaginosa TaxID=43675 RepID=UPI0028DD3F2D